MYPLFHFGSRPRRWTLGARTVRVLQARISFAGHPYPLIRYLIRCRLTTGCSSSQPNHARRMGWTNGLDEGSLIALRNLCYTLPMTFDDLDFAPSPLEQLRRTAALRSDYLDLSSSNPTHH